MDERLKKAAYPGLLQDRPHAREAPAHATRHDATPNADAPPLAPGHDARTDGPPAGARQPLAQATRAKGLSAATVTRPKAVWAEGYDAWGKQRPKAKALRHDPWQAAPAAAAEEAFGRPVATYRAGSGEAAGRPAKDREGLLASPDFPAGHGARRRATDPIESTSAPVRLRAVTAKGGGSRSARPAVVVRLLEVAPKGWRLPDGAPLLSAGDRRGAVCRWGGANRRRLTQPPSTTFDNCSLC